MTSRPELSVIAPCLNEALNVPELAKRVLGAFDKGGLRGELVIVDDGSTDDTAAVIRSLETAHPGRVVGCFHATNRGIEQGWRSGIDAASAPVVAVIDADLQYQPEDLVRLYRELMQSGVDVVQGYRSQIGRTRGKRYHISRGFNVLLNGTFGMRLRDNKSGFVMCEKQVFQDLLTHRQTYFYWQSFVMVAAHAKGYAYKEVETLFEDRRAGTSFLDAIAYRASARSLVDLAKAFVEYRLQDPTEDVADRFLAAHATTPTPSVTPTVREQAALRAYVATLDEKKGGVTGAVVRRIHRMEKTQWLSVDAIRALQDEKLRRLVRHAVRDVPFYRERLRERGIRPDDVRTVADLSRLPLLTRADVKQHLYFDLLGETRVLARIRRRTSLGPRGEITSVFVERRQLEARFAAEARAATMAGARFGETRLVLESSFGERASSSFDAALAGVHRLDASVIDDAFVRHFVATVTRLRPVLIEGETDVLDCLARRLEAGGGVPFAPPRAVVAHGQTISAETRSRVAGAFGAPLRARYSTGDLGCIAVECEAADGYHVSAENLVVEVLVGDRPAQPGESGRVIVTDLESFCMPFVRYDVGDGAMLLEGACACGRGLPRLGRIEGREPAIVEGADGRSVPVSYLTSVVRRFDHAFSQVSIAQPAAGRVALSVRRGGRFSDDALRDVRAAFARALGPVTVEVDLRDAAPEAPVDRVVARPA